MQRPIQHPCNIICLFFYPKNMNLIKQNTIFFKIMKLNLHIFNAITKFSENIFAEYGTEVTKTFKECLS